MKFQFPRSVELAQVPTPIDKMEHLTKVLEGPEIYLKRDDFTGVALTGNKVRKLEFLLSEALEKNCDFIITCGGYQSNHARTTAIAAAQLRLKCHLVLRNSMSAPLQGNLFLDKLVGAEIEYVTPEEYMQIDDIMMRIAENAKSSGRKPYIIPEGGSNELGTLGYVKAAEEISKQLQASKLRIDHIVVAVGSGGTYAGLLLGKFLYDLSAEIHGINVCDDESFFVKKISAILNQAQKRFDLPVNIKNQDIKIIDGYVGKGYGLSSQSEIDLIKHVAQEEGVILDPIYTGKAMLGLTEEIRKGTFKPNQRVLFVHTGGIFGVFAKQSLFF